jgi:hypothetical protein
MGIISNDTMHVFINAMNWTAMDAHLCSTILSRAFDMKYLCRSLISYIHNGAT